MSTTPDGPDKEEASRTGGSAAASGIDGDGATATRSATGAYSTPLPESGDAAGGTLDPARAAITANQIDQELIERRQEARHREHFVGLALGIVIIFYGALLVAICIGNGDSEVRATFSNLSVLKVSLLSDGPSHIYLTKLGILAAIPTAVLIRLAGMLRKDASDDKKKVDDVPLASVTVASEALKAIAEVAKSFVGKA